MLKVLVGEALAVLDDVIEGGKPADVGNDVDAEVGLTAAAVGEGIAASDAVAGVAAETDVVVNDHGMQLSVQYWPVESHLSLPVVTT